MAEFLCAGWQHNVDKVVDAVRLFFAYALSMAEHKVYLYFQLSSGWHCQFLEPDLKTSLPRKLTFKSADKLRDLIEHGHGITTQESRSMVEYAISNGRGGVFLKLTEEQYVKLKR